MAHVEAGRDDVHKSYVWLSDALNQREIARRSAPCASKGGGPMADGDARFARPLALLLRDVRGRGSTRPCLDPSIRDNPTDSRSCSRRLGMSTPRAFPAGPGLSCTTAGRSTASPTDTPINSERPAGRNAADSSNSGSAT